VAHLYQRGILHRDVVKAANVLLQRSDDGGCSPEETKGWLLKLVDYMRKSFYKTASLLAASECMPL